MIDTQSEFIRLLEYMEKHMARALWVGIKLEGGSEIVAFCEN